MYRIRLKCLRNGCAVRAVQADNFCNHNGSSIVKENNREEIFSQRGPKNANLGIFNLVNKLYENDSTGCCEGGCSSDIIGYEWDELSMFKTVPCLLSDCGV